VALDGTEADFAIPGIGLSSFAIAFRRVAARLVEGKDPAVVTVTVGDFMEQVLAEQEVVMAEIIEELL
jgi:hypothetical protein